MLRLRNLLSPDLYDPPRLRHRVNLFFQVKLVLAVTGLVLSTSILAPRLDLIAVMFVAALVDLLFVVPFYFWIRRGPRAVLLGTSASIAISSVVVAVSVHLAGDFTAPLVFGYFLLLPLVYLIIPHAEMGWIFAGLTSATYVALVFAEMTGLAPLVHPSRIADLQPWLGYAAIIVLGLWGTAGLAGQVVARIEQQRQAAVQLVEESRRRTAAETIWSTVGKTVTATQDLDEVLTAVMQIINEKMHVETGSVLLRELQTDRLVFAKILHGNLEKFSSVRLRVGQGIVGWVVATGCPALVPDVTRDPRWASSVDRQTGFVTRSILCVPLIVKDEVIGAIELLNKQDGTFAMEDLQLLESIAAPVAIAIQNARLHQQVQNQLLEQTRLLAKIERAKNEWESTIDALDEGIALMDIYGKILRANRVLAEWLHTTPGALVGQYCYRVVHDQDAPPPYCPHAQLMLAQDHMYEAEVEEPRLNGIFRCAAYPLRATDGTFIGAVKVLKNVTVEKRLQAQVIQSEKLAATGRLAASLAHEINNPLQAIQGCLDLTLVNLENTEKQQRYLTLAKSELERLTVIVRRMLDFYRPKGKRAIVDLRPLLDDVLALTAKRLQHAKIVMQTEWDTGVPMVNGVEDQLKQVFLNLILNAADAMPTGGELHIRGRMVTEGGEWVTLAFTDSGQGIPADVLDKIFEPFFTTKAEGTGLGLAVSHNIITSHGGRLLAESTVGKGSTFTVWLPVRAV